MAMTCTVCRHPERKAIDRALLERQPSRAIAIKYGFQGRSAIWRHGLHIARALSRSEKLKAREALDHARWLAGELRQIAKEARVHPGQFLSVADRLDKSIRTLGTLNGEIQPATMSAFILQLGARDEGEVRRALELARGSGDVTLESCRDDALDLVLLAATQDPAWRAVVVSRLQREPSEAVVESNGHPVEAVT